MGSKYLKGDMVKCEKDFFMNSESLAFKKGKVYSIDRVESYPTGSGPEYDYTLTSEIDSGHIMPDEAVDEYFRKVETLPVIVHKYYCGCYGIPIDSINGLIFKACDDDSGEYFMSIRNMTDKESEPMKWDDQDELLREMDSLLHRGHRVTDFAFLVNQINEKK